MWGKKVYFTLLTLDMCDKVNRLELENVSCDQVENWFVECDYGNTMYNGKACV